MRNKKIFSEGIVEELRKVPVFRYFFRKGKRNAQTLPKEHSLINLMRFFMFDGSPVTRAEVLFYLESGKTPFSVSKMSKWNSCIVDYCDVVLMKSSQLLWVDTARAGSGEFQNACNFECNLHTLQSLHSISQYEVLEEGCIGDITGFENHTMLWLEIPQLPKVDLIGVDRQRNLRQNLLDKKSIL